MIISRNWLEMNRAIVFFMFMGVFNNVKIASDVYPRVWSWLGNFLSIFDWNRIGLLLIGGIIEVYLIEMMSQS